MNKRFYAYVRVSTTKQSANGSSLTEQKNAIEDYADRNGLVIERWFEEVETAAKRGRRVFSQMMEQLQAGRADGLIVHKIDRSARNPRDWADLGELIDRGIDVRFVSDNFDLLSRGGRLSADIQAVVAVDYIRNLREEVKKGIYGRLRQGLYPFAAPMGYLNTGKAKPKVIDPVKGPLIRLLFERYATNEIGFEELRHEMWGNGLRTAAGKPLYDRTLTALLNNPFYVGVIRIGTTGETFTGAHEPLIAKGLFDRVQSILRAKTVPKAKRHQFLFRQIVKCSDCAGRHLTGEIQKGHVYYRCHGPDCPGVSWRSEDLEEIVLSQVRRIRLDAEGLGDLRDLVRDLCQNEEGERNRLKSSTALRLQQVDDRCARLTDLLIDNVIDQRTFNERREKLLVQRQGIVEGLRRISQPSPLNELLAGFERQNSELLRYDLLDNDEKREVIEMMSSNFSVSAESSTFTLRSPYREMAESDDFAECAHDRSNVRTERLCSLLKNIAEKEIGTGDTVLLGSRPWEDGHVRCEVPKVPKPPPTARANTGDFNKPA